MVHVIRRLLPFAAGLLALLAAGIAAAQDLYRVSPGDVLRIEVLEDESLNRTLLVAPDGRITVPLAGAIQAGGRSVEAVQNSITEQLTPNFAAPPTVFVSLEQLAPEAPPLPAVPAEEPVITLSVLGEVNNPGRVATEPGTTLLEFFAQVGGFTPFAATERIQLRRRDASGTETIYLLDYEAILEGRSPNGTTLMADGDVVVVPERRLFE